MKIPFLNTLYRWYGKRTVILVLVALITLFVAGFFVTERNNSAQTAESDEVLLPTVRVSAAGSLTGQSITSLVGTVSAENEAVVQAESSGRVVSVNTALGNRVQAGQLLVQLENATQRAAVLQAEGAYEAALASAAQSDVGVDEANTTVVSAKNTAISAARDAYSSNNQVVLTTIDDIFANPTSWLPGLLIDTGFNTSFLNNERVAYQELLTEWQQEINALDINDNLESELRKAVDRTQRTLAIVDIVIESLSDEDPGRFTETELQQMQADFTAARATLNTTVQSLQAAMTSLTSAEEALQRAEIAGSNNTGVSAASAQVKQALGALRSAEAALSKTIVRAPISGEVNRFDVQVGDFLQNGAEVALVANNSALLVTTFVGENDRSRIAVGDQVLIDGTIEGMVTTIAPAVDTATGKTEVKVQAASERLQNGDTVTISIVTNEIQTPQDSSVRIPITAVRFTGESASVFTVDNSLLQSQPIEVGGVTGSYIEVVSGLSAATEIVIDARGLSVGEKVEAIR